MGRYSWSDRRLVEDCRSISIFWLNQNGLLRDSYNGGIRWLNEYGKETSSIGIEVHADNDRMSTAFIRLRYNYLAPYSDSDEQIDYQIQLTTTKCYFGGVRYWFVCPLSVNGVACNRRIGTLYKPRNGQYFGCRHCYNLTYRDRKEHNRTVSALLNDPARLMKRLSASSDELDLPALKAALKLCDN